MNFTSEWKNNLICCPSQLTRQFEHNGKTYELYCRWRWSDPWTFAFYGKNQDMEPWVNIGSGMTQYDEIPDVHTFAENLLTKYLTDN